MKIYDERCGAFFWEAPDDVILHSNPKAGITPDATRKIYLELIGLFLKLLVRITKAQKARAELFNDLTNTLVNFGRHIERRESSGNPNA